MTTVTLEVHYPPADMPDADRSGDRELQHH